MNAQILIQKVMKLETKLRNPALTDSEIDDIFSEIDALEKRIEYLEYQDQDYYSLASERNAELIELFRNEY